MRFPERCPVCLFNLDQADIEPCMAIARCGGCGEWLTAWPVTATSQEILNLSTASPQPGRIKP